MNPIPLDLAFSVDEGLDPALLGSATSYGDPLAGAALWEGLLGRWLRELEADLPAALRAPGYSLGLSLCGDAGIAELNGRWRQVEGPTDVLAFAAADDAGVGAPPMPRPVQAEPEPLELGDIVISVETASRQAAGAGQPLEWELAWLASHGLLHLLGWDHPTEARLREMLDRQEHLLSCAH
ncbi:rRNA maturation RNase YbeY [Synechococcus sp. CS-1325]|uniref:rRNA maturation RNase YbeY n=1 Tax=unclassified Synechococcus TaxID=2626047 RepID=UPI000DB2E329|nr:MULTISPECIES: rRNA maturation RNase YbeY [unclassified Synechococcus]MCT0199802.1 rRNA maturation RNase YbeY [Synechococcus sp. CS-1325]MCT0231353.1 rRNA maturation RNase YbeY [Synechococcus sp. CS-1324]PZU99222.1 MAG: rRNA maturation RNase YbeY [Cyanobium sp.]PZV02669.1 MAG: rRNA maturation RNase YbeY [Cyanobium sp.]